MAGMRKRNEGHTRKHRKCPTKFASAVVRDTSSPKPRQPCSARISRSVFFLSSPHIERAVTRGAPIAPSARRTRQNESEKSEVSSAAQPSTIASSCPSEFETRIHCHSDLGSSSHASSLPPPPSPPRTAHTDQSAAAIPARIKIPADTNDVEGTPTSLLPITTIPARSQLAPRERELTDYETLMMASSPHLSPSRSLWSPNCAQNPATERE